MTSGKRYPPLTVHELLTALLRITRASNSQSPNFLDKKNPSFKQLHGTLDIHFTARPCSHISRKVIVSPRELISQHVAGRLSDLVGRWAKDCTGAAGVLDLVVKEQLLSTLPEDARLWVSEHKPKTSEEAGQLAEDFLQARQSISRTPAKPFGGEPPHTPCPKCGQAGHWARDCPRARSGGPAPSKEQAAKQEREAPPVRCYNCKQRGHVAAKCPSNAARRRSRRTTLPRSES